MTQFSRLSVNTITRSSFVGICSVLAYLISFPTWSLLEPTPFNAEYSVKMNGMIVGKSQLALHVVQPNRFVGTSSLETVGLAAMLKKYRLKTSAEWLLDKSRMRLLESEYQLTSGEEKSSGKLLFSWSPASVQLTDNLGTKILVIPADTISRNALPFALAHDLKKGKDSIEYAFVDGRKANRVRHMSFTKTGEELLKTKIGDIQTVVLKRSDEVPASYYWYAPELNYVVVKMQYPDELFNSDIITEITRYQSIPQETLSQSKPSAK